MARGDWKRTPEVSAGESLCDREAWRNDVPKRDRYEIALLGSLVGVARRVDDPELTRVGGIRSLFHLADDLRGGIDATKWVPYPKPEES